MSQENFVPATLDELAARITAIEARQRDHRMHDANCPVRKAEIHNEHGLTYMAYESCNCWLVK
jgi:hypothetical protein